MSVFPSSFTRFDRLLVYLGLATIVCMLSPRFAVALTTTHVLFPLAVIMAAIPAAFLFLALVRLVMFVLPFRHGWIAAVGMAVLVVVAVPLIVNWRLEASAQAMAAGDFDALQRPFRERTLGVVTVPGYWSQGETACDDFCMYALLSGALDRVVVATTRKFDRPVDANERAVAFHMEHRSTCPRVRLRSGVNPINGDANASYPLPPAEPAKWMRSEIAKGNCLIESRARVGDAGVVVRIGTVKQGVTAYRAGLNAFADTVTADRISAWVRASGGFEERYRRTTVVTHKLFPVLLPTYVEEYEPTIGTAFLRDVEHINTLGEHSGMLERRKFFIETLALQLTPQAAD